MLTSKNLAILMTDMKDFTQYITHASRPESMELIKKHENLLLPVLEAYGGTLIKTIGDSFLATFESPTNAVLAGMELQRTLREHNAALADPQKKIEVRVAISAGEVTLAESDVYGEAVNIASRLLGIADPNEVYFTEAVYLLMNKKEVPSSEIGFRHLKGVPEKVKIYKVLSEAPVNVAAEAQTAAPSQPVPEAPSLPAATRESPGGRATGEREGLAPGFSHPPAGFGRRLGAYLIDLFLVALLTGALHDDDLFILVGAVYFVTCWTLGGVTLGKKLLGLKVVREGGGSLSLGIALVRYVGYLLAGLPLGVGYLWAWWDPKHQGWHDKIAGTRVVRVR